MMERSLSEAMVTFIALGRRKLVDLYVKKFLKVFIHPMMLE